MGTGAGCPCFDSMIWLLFVLFVAAPQAEHASSKTVITLVGGYLTCQTAANTARFILQWTFQLHEFGQIMRSKRLIRNPLDISRGQIIESRVIDRFIQDGTLRAILIHTLFTQFSPPGLT